MVTIDRCPQIASEINLRPTNSRSVRRFEDWRQHSIDTASEVLGNTRKNKKPWMTNDILDLCDRRRSFKKRTKNGPVPMQKYSEVNQEIRRRMKQATDTGSQTDVKKFDSGIRTENSKAAFSTLKLLTTDQDKFF